MNNIKNIAFDVGGVLAEPITGHWFITPNFWNIIDKDIINYVFLFKRWYSHNYI